jgi:ABC-type nitrate/sulfonate/bicarbonate transport system permease component
MLRCFRLFMAVPVNLELSAQGESRRSRLARLYLAHEPGAIAGGALLALLLLWEALGASGLVDPLFISSPTRVAKAAWELSHDRDFWNDLRVSATEFIVGYGAALATSMMISVSASRTRSPVVGPNISA